MLEFAQSVGTASGYVFPNDLHVHWSLMIVLYPYITGVVAGAFIVSSMYHVFGVRSLRPIAHFSLLFAFAFWACATLPLLAHLGQPGRAFSMFLTPNPRSAMAGFGYFYLTYGVILALEIFFLYRPVLVARALSNRGWKKRFYQALSMASDNVSSESLRIDAKITHVLAGIGIPMACVLHGYVGFIFGGVKANPLWATPLMPVIFLLSACISGIAGILLGYYILERASGREPDVACVRTALKYLWGFFILGFSFEMLEILSHGYKATSHWHTLHALLWGPLYNSYWIWQVLILSIIPLCLLGYLCLVRPGARVIHAFTPFVAVMVLLQVFFMRWNVVIGGQLMSKSGRGAVYFEPGWFDREGIVLSLVIMVLPVMVLIGLGKIFPFWLDEPGSAGDVDHPIGL